MNLERKKVIVQELRYWKENKLLPKEYCDFLLALYTEGEGVSETTGTSSTWKTVLTMLDVSLLLLLIPLSFLVIYFTEISNLMQTSLLIIFLVITYTHMYLFKRNNSIYFHLALIVFLLIFLLLSFNLGGFLGESNLMVYSLALLNFLGWLVYGIKKRLYYLVASGIIGMIGIVIYLVYF